MPQSPVCYFTFADNGQTDWLKHIKKERRGIRAALRPLHKKGFIEMQQEGYVEIDQFFDDVLDLEEEDLVIFHFSGHGDANVIFTESGAATSISIAGLLAHKKDSLGLVFLNACSTAGQVRELHRLGIKAVIATSDKISDNMAMEFSIAFYQALGKGYNLKGAFLFAVSFVRRILEQASFSAKIYRGLDLRNDEPSVKMLPWGLFIHPSENEEQVLQWKLPQKRDFYFPESNYTTDEALLDVDRILHKMANYHKGLSNLKLDPKITIVQHFPWVISTHIRRLLVNQPPMNQHSLVRLQELVQTYVAGTRFLAFVLLSQLWDVVQNGSLALGDDFPGLMAWRAQTERPFDYFELTFNLVDLLSNLKVCPFIHELEENIFFREDGRDVSIFMNKVKKLLISGDLRNKDVHDLCLKVESYCNDFLCQIAFLSGYRLIAVKDIRINKIKHLPPTYTHRIFRWNVFDKSISSDRDLSVREFTDSYSILLVKPMDGKDPGAIGPFLNLSPFFIDKSTFSARPEHTPLPAIFVLEAETEKSLRFVSADRDVNNLQDNPADWLEINDDTIQYESIWELWKIFKRDLEVAGWRQ